MEYKWTVLTVTTVGIFMSTLDASIVVVGLPIVVLDLNTSLMVGVWIITAYRLMTTILLVAFGRIADIFGRVKLYNMGFAIFTIGSALCAISQGAEQLILSRIVQGLGGALMFVNGIVIVVDAFDPKELGTAIGINMMSINAGTIVGYTLSGVLIGLFGWRSIFAINIPVGVFGTLWAHRRLRELFKPALKQKLDYVGALTFSAALTLLLIALTASEITSVSSLAMILTSLLLWVFFIWYERHVTQPVLDLSIFAIRPFAAGNLANLLDGIAFGALAFLMALYFEVVRGLGPIETGLALIPLDVTLILIGPLSGRLSDKYGARLLATSGLIITSVGLVLLAGLTTDTPYLTVAVYLAVVGLGLGMFRSPNASSVLGSIPPERRGVASGVRSTILSLSFVVSVPFAVAFMSTRLPFAALSAALGGGGLGTGEADLLLQAIRISLLAAAAINTLAVFPSILREQKPTAYAPTTPSLHSES